MKVLQIYANRSGQLVNFAKSNVFFNSNVIGSNRADVVRILGVPYAGCLEQYLGFPCIFGRNKKRAFASLRDKIGSRISSWSTRLLLIRGCEVFIKLVMQVILTYAMMCFLLFTTFCGEIEAILAKI